MKYPHRRDAKAAEIKYFSFVAETPTNENPQPLRGRIIFSKIATNNICRAYFYCQTPKKKNLPGGLGFISFRPLTEKK